MQQYSALFFDLGGTLVYRIVSQDRILRLLCEELNLSLPARPDWGGAASAWRAYHASHYLSCRTRDAEEDLLARETRLILEHLTMAPCPPAVAERFQAGLTRAARWWGIYDDVMPTLNYVKASGLATGLISNWEPSLADFVREMGLSHALPLTVSSVEEGIEKPSPRLFEIAAERMEVAPENCLYVGDDYRADVVGARAAGMTPVLLDRNERYLDTDCITIHRLDEVIDILQGHVPPPQSPGICFSGFSL